MKLNEFIEDWVSDLFQNASHFTFVERHSFNQATLTSMGVQMFCIRYTKQGHKYYICFEKNREKVSDNSQHRYLQYQYNGWKAFGPFSDEERLVIKEILGEVPIDEVR